MYCHRIGGHLIPDLHDFPIATRPYAGCAEMATCTIPQIAVMPVAIDVTYASVVAADRRSISGDFT